MSTHEAGGRVIATNIDNPRPISNGVNLREELARIVKGDVSDDVELRTKYSRDASIFERMPSLVVCPKDAEDVSALVRFVSEVRSRGEQISLTARAAGTCMSGGSLTDSIVISFTKYMNRMLEISHDPDATVGTGYAVAESGVFYRDFERETLAKLGMILPPYPASRELAALGGMISNNAGGELTLRFGKMDQYVRELEMVLSDGSRATFRPLTEAGLEAKKREETLEGKIYRSLHTLIADNAEEIRNAKPSVSKNSAGYALWDVWDQDRKVFDVTQIIAGSQGTLGLITKAKLGIEKIQHHRAMLVVFLSDFDVLPEVVKRILEFKPESFESYDDHTFSIAVRYLWQFIKRVGVKDMLRLGFAFLPEVWMTLTGRVPKFVLMAEFSEISDKDARDKARDAHAALYDLPVKARLAFGKMEAEKYWKIRRESFALLRKAYHGLKAAPFIDDIVVHPKDYPKFLPELTSLLAEYDVIYTIAGHIGDGNFHIIPLENLGRPHDRDVIRKLTPKVYELVARFKGSITGEHGDGIIRTPYLPLMFSPHVIELFAETKRIFDPLNIFNPGKKTGGTIQDIEKYMIRHG